MACPHLSDVAIEILIALSTLLSMSPAIISFIKGVGVVVLFAVLTYLGDAANLSGILSPVLATVIASMVSAYEAHLKEQSGGTTALFGAVSVR